MRIKSIFISGFRSFRNATTIQWPTRPGVFHVCGENLIFPELGSNGVGKSSIFEAITWCLFGKTSTGARTHVLTSRGASSCDVAVVYERDGVTHTIRRTNGTVTCDGVVVSDIEATLGISYGVFCATTCLAHNAAMFVDLTPAQRLALLSDVLCLDVWQRARDIAAERMRSLEAEIASIHREHARAQSDCVSLQAKYAEQVRARDEFDASERRRCDAAKARAEELCSYRDDLREQLRVLGGSIQTIHETLAECEIEKTKYADILAQQTETHVRLRERLAAMDADAATADAECHRIRSANVNGRCVVCGASWTADAQSRLRTAIRKREHIQAQCKELRAQIDALEKELGQTRDRISAISARIETTNDALAADRMKTVRLRAAIDGVEREHRTVMADATPRANPHMESVRVCAEMLDAAKQRVAELDARRNQLQAQLRPLEYWTTGFRDVRLWLLRSGLSEMATVATSIWMALGMSGTIRCAIERETASGGISRGVNVDVLLDERGAVPVTSLSAGEMQRARIAITAGLADVLRARSMTAFNSEIWDEPTSHLSREGISRMVSMLRHRARASGRIIVLADHHVFESGMFDDVLHVSYDGTSHAEWRSS